MTRPDLAAGIQSPAAVGTHAEAAGVRGAHRELPPLPGLFEIVGMLHAAVATDGPPPDPARADRPWTARAARGPYRFALAAFFRVLPPPRPVIGAASLTLSPSTSRRNFPVWLAGTAATCSGEPSATTRPPA